MSRTRRRRNESIFDQRLIFHILRAANCVAPDRNSLHYDQAWCATIALEEGKIFNLHSDFRVLHFFSFVRIVLFRLLFPPLEIPNKVRGNMSSVSN